MTMPLEPLWDKICQTLKARLNADIYARWIAVIHPKALHGDTLWLTVSNDFYQSWLEENYLPLIKETAGQICGHKVQVQFEVNPALSVAPLPAAAEVTPARRSAPWRKAAASGTGHDIILNPKYTFASFVVGPSNSFAHASSLAVAQAPGKAYNPLFIYGGVGLGKTHLMQAIGHYVATQARSRICYLSCESLMNEFIDALQNHRTKHFRDKYRSMELLLIDDIHFLAKTDALQEEFFHTFNALYDAHKQIVITSDRPAGEISGLEQRLVSRFEWGLVTELIPPDFETCMAILHSKQATLNVPLPEEVLVFMASNIRSNIRKLEGALTRLTSYAALYQKPITVNLAQELLASNLEQERGGIVTMDTIQRTVADYFDMRLADMTSKHRSQGVALPRQVAMYLARTLTDHSLPEIGLAFSKTHATVLYACRHIEKSVQKKPQLKQIVTKLSRQLECNPAGLPI